MKKLLLATLTLSCCACYAHVVAVSDTGVYIRNSTGAPMNLTETKDRLPSKVKFMPEAEARQADSFKAKSLIALY